MRHWIAFEVDTCQSTGALLLLGAILVLQMMSAPESFGWSTSTGGKVASA